jgi:uncharacterized tellurite resistance protein B-like protein
MNDVAGSAARWLGILGSGVLIGEEAVRSARRAQQVLGREAVGDLRKWFDTLDPSSSLDAKCAVIELCIAMIHADRKITERERALFDQIVERAELDTESAEALRARLLAPPPLEAIIPRIPHPVLREVALLLAWQVAVADGRPAMEEFAAYGLLADRLGISPRRASELRERMRQMGAPAPADASTNGDGHPRTADSS